MTALAIRLDQLSKQYRFGARPRRRTLREALTEAAASPWRNLRRLAGAAGRGTTEDDTFWALRDVSFEVGHGEVLGVIGRNGAGKSTLLKLLSRITAPTSGRAEVWGRVGSLLEVGTGFHPELTGRDNVYLNGAILGMERGYITSRFDAIVEFAGVEQFIDTPVKRYSSGMYLRLAFAVAAHLEPDVLIVDEVLAVGDAEFQQKCIGRMNEVACDGRTVLFVSHNLGAVQRLCTRSILLEKGNLVADGETSEVIRQYLASHDTEAPAGRWIDLTAAPRTGSASARFTGVQYGSGDHLVDFSPHPGGPLEIVVGIDASIALNRPRVGFTLRDRYGGPLISGSTYALGVATPLPIGYSSWRFVLETLPLRPGPYQLELWLADSMGASVDRLQPALWMEVFDRQPRGFGPHYNPRHDGILYCEYSAGRVEAAVRHRTGGEPASAATQSR